MLTDDQLKKILDNEIESAVGYIGGELQEEREAAKEFYRGEAVGELAAPETEGRSSVVSTDVADVIEWIKPAVLKTFVSTDEAVRFDPTSADDEEQAEQESDYVNYVFYKENRGFLVLYSWIHDALLEKVGTVKVYWDEEKKVTTEEYSRLNDHELAILLDDDEVEPIEHTASPEIVSDEMGGAVEVVYHDIKVKRTCVYGKAAVDPVPPEEVLVNADHRSIFLDEARFAAHECIKTVSELVQMGFKFDEVKDLPAYDVDPEDDDRNTVTDEDDADKSSDPALKKIRLYECYPLIDYDEDGVAERRRILYVKGSKILENEEADNVPLISMTPIIMPHRYVGMSIYDRIREISKQKTAIWRNLLDNMYLQNNQRTYVNTANKVNLDDLLTNRPGGIVRGKGLPGETIFPLTTAPTGAAGYQMLEYLDKVREERGGVGPDSMGMNQQLSNDTAHGLERLMSAKEELVGLITRVFGETGIKEMFLQLRALLAKHQDKEKVVNLRGKWVPVNPSEWRERTSSTIKVGMGTGDRMKQQTALQQILGYQEKLIMAGSGMASQKNIFNALQDLAKASGIDADQYFTDPETLPQPQPKSDPTAQIAQMQFALQQRDQELQKLKIESDNANKAADRAQKAEEAVRELAAKLTDLELKYGQNVPGAMV